MSDQPAVLLLILVLVFFFLFLLHLHPIPRLPPPFFPDIFWATPRHFLIMSRNRCRCRRKRRIRIRTRNEMNQLRLELTPQTFSTEKRSKDYIQRDRREERGQRQTQAYSPLAALGDLFVNIPRFDPEPSIALPVFLSLQTCPHRSLRGSRSFAYFYRLRERLRLCPCNTRSATPKSRHYRLTISVPVFPLPISWYSTSPSRATRKCGWSAGTRYESPA